MKREEFNPPEDGTDLGTPRFDEQAKEAARPVVPLSQIDGTEFKAGSARRQHATLNAWPRGLVLVLALAAVVAAATAVAVYRNTSVRMTPDSPQAVNAATSTIATDSIVGPVSTKPSEDDASNAQSQPPRGSLPQSGSTLRHESVRGDFVEDERRKRHDDHDDDDDKWDEEKSAKRARKEEKKRFERGRKEAEKLAERGRDSERRGEPKPRLVGIYTEKN
jgi:hypothetical protein